MYQKERAERFQYRILQALANELNETSPLELPSKCREFFGGEKIRAVYEERTNILYILFTEDLEKPQIVLGFGDQPATQWRGFLQWGVYQNDGGEMDIYGETQLMSPFLTLWDMFEKIEKELGGLQNQRPCPEHEGGYDCSPFCAKCGGDQYLTA